MADKTWKQVERRHAQMCGGRRIPVLGRRGPDVAHPTLAVESKTRKRVPSYLYEWVQQAEMGAQPSKIPVVVIHQKGQRFRNDLAVLRWETLLELLDKAEKEVA